MTGDDDGRAGTKEGSEGRGRERAAPGTGGDERRHDVVPEPAPEEAPELLGERSDYPIAWDDDEQA